MKFDGQREACWVMDGNFTPSMPQEECFASVVYTEAVCLGFVPGFVPVIAWLCLTMIDY